MFTIKRLLKSSSLLVTAMSLAALSVSVTGCKTHTVFVGRSSYEQLEPERMPSPKKSNKSTTESDIRADYIPGYVSIDLKKPVYPSVALAGRTGRTVVYARVSFDEKGQVSEVSRSWRGISLQDPYSEVFFEAVKTAVSSWKIEPPRMVYWQTGKDGAEDKYLRTETLLETTDVKFTFEADGVVK